MTTPELHCRMGLWQAMAEQNAEAGLDVADDLAVMARGEIVFRADAETARTPAWALRAFLGEAALG